MERTKEDFHQDRALAATECKLVALQNRVAKLELSMSECLVKLTALADEWEPIRKLEDGASRNE